MILTFVLNTEQFQLRYVQNRLMYQIIEKQCVQANRSHNNKNK